MPEDSDQKYAEKSWWLRTHNSDNEGVVFVNRAGYLDCAKEGKTAVIRAAMWIDISGVE